MPFSFGFKSKSLISLPLNCTRLRTAGQMFHWSDSVEYASLLCAPAYYISMRQKFMDNFFHFNCTSAIANGSLFIYAMADAIHFHFVLLCFFSSFCYRQLMHQRYWTFCSLLLTLKIYILFGWFARNIASSHFANDKKEWRCTIVYGAARRINFRFVGICICFCLLFCMQNRNGYFRNKTNKNQTTTKKENPFGALRSLA